MKEKDFQIEFKKINRVEGVFELKLLKVSASGTLPPLPFDRVADHQIEALKSASNGTGLYHKISDSFIGDKSGQRRFPSPKPFDCLFLKSVDAYVVVCYYIPRKLKAFYYIPIAAFLRRKSISARKSLPVDIIEYLSRHIVINGEYKEKF